MVKILGFSGSIRKNSYNSALLKTAKELLPDGCAMDIFSLRRIPLYDDDLARGELTKPAHAFRSAIDTADGLLIACPEYNYSISGVLKNALDWASTDTLSNLLAGKPTAIMGASRTIFGTARAQLHLRQVLTAANAPVVRKPEVFVLRAQNLFGKDGELTDLRTREKMQALLSALEELIRLSL